MFSNIITVGASIILENNWFLTFNKKRLLYGLITRCSAEYLLFLHPEKIDVRSKLIMAFFYADLYLVFTSINFSEYSDTSAQRATGKSVISSKCINAAYS